MEVFELKHRGNSITIYNIQYSDAESKSGNSYNTRFSIKVVSNAAYELFSGIGFCEYDMKELILFARHIEELYDFSRSRAKFHDICYGSWIDFEMGKLGHLHIKGKIYGLGMVHNLEFEFSADQSSLGGFMDSLKKLYKYQ